MKTLGLTADSLAVNRRTPPARLPFAADRYRAASAARKPLSSPNHSTSIIWSAAIRALGDRAPQPIEALRPVTTVALLTQRALRATAPGLRASNSR